MDSIDEKELNAFKKDKLIKIILDLQRKVEELTSYKLIENRIVKLEKGHFSQLQYERRDTNEIDGIPVSVPHEEVEEAALAVLGKIGVDCGSDEVQACHRLNKKGGECEGSR